jgi:hypothetical protein
MAERRVPSPGKAIFCLPSCQTPPTRPPAASRFSGGADRPRRTAVLPAPSTCRILRRRRTRLPDVLCMKWRTTALTPKLRLPPRSDRPTPRILRTGEVRVKAVDVLWLIALAAQQFPGRPPGAQKPAPALRSSGTDESAHSCRSAACLSELTASAVMAGHRAAVSRLAGTQVPLSMLMIYFWATPLDLNLSPT